MSVVYSHRTDKFVDTDCKEVCWLADGDVIPWDDDEALIEAWKEGMIPDSEMVEMGFDMDELMEKSNGGQRSDS